MSLPAVSRHPSTRLTPVTGIGNKADITSRHRGGVFVAGKKCVDDAWVELAPRAAPNLVDRLLKRPGDPERKRGQQGPACCPTLRRSCAGTNPAGRPPPSSLSLRWASTLATRVSCRRKNL
jgi:hypothetical protein